MCTTHFSIPSITSHCQSWFALARYFLSKRTALFNVFGCFRKNSAAAHRREHVEMDFMRLFGALIAFLFHYGCASKINGQRICRRGTERPCYKVSYIQDSRRRLTFQDARQACRVDGGELLSIETESEQRLIERFIQQLHAADGDFWIGLRRSPQRFRSGNANPGCPSQYYWLDGSKAKFRNWHWDEPSCGGEMCVVLYYQPSAPPDEEGHFLFQWNDDNCNTKNNYICKYPKVKTEVFTEAGRQNAAHAVPTVMSNIFFTTSSGKTIKVGMPESSGESQRAKAPLGNQIRGCPPKRHLALFKDPTPLVTSPNFLTSFRTTPCQQTSKRNTPVHLQRNPSGMITRMYY
ncbi:C-type lectin domain family 18 member A isoform X2 [Hippocampus zosterae]|uniref:C-type lectin domain family 18 member A isoform X2 n=1 Tax=Hippocampus zosterae TaxID=109293 RepID=UPI00223CA93B|nr:C-type lectin domain family 18 member A isoform X2 [Hippocampus zosterae]